MPLFMSLEDQAQDAGLSIILSTQLFMRMAVRVNTIKAAAQPPTGRSAARSTACQTCASTREEGGERP